jgi:hypothetical protein
MRVGFYIACSKCVICISLSVLTGPVLMIDLGYSLINNLAYIFVNWPVLSFSHEDDAFVFPSADMEAFGHLEHIFCVYFTTVSVSQTVWHQL